MPLKYSSLIWNLNGQLKDVQVWTWQVCSRSSIIRGEGSQCNLSLHTKTDDIIGSCFIHGFFTLDQSFFLMSLLSFISVIFCIMADLHISCMQDISTSLLYPLYIWTSLASKFLHNFYEKSGLLLLRICIFCCSTRVVYKAKYISEWFPIPKGPTIFLEVGILFKLSWNAFLNQGIIKLQVTNLASTLTNND